eukprot:CAMPEP_0183368350 /NCGR_PEP_ID=MMETSP0164_2-20130417/95583_1 /TAXON_ID=221442 /ORGANISM="Coccolithus pelagicus ssp braarudi, Strain PLY182g" /LENGTH=131 /DNA_ID=CAMNT_0025544427 /DNA_START=669 /DNA_END=1064 /DNA_ORIENTATION=-
MVKSVRRIDDAALADHEIGVLFRHERRVDDLGHPILAAAFAHGEACVNQVCEDVPADCLLGVVGKHGARISADLIGHHYRNIELLRKLLELVDDLAQALLSLGEFASARVVEAEGHHDRIDYDEPILFLDE